MGVCLRSFHSVQDLLSAVFELTMGLPSVHRVERAVARGRAWLVVEEPTMPTIDTVPRPSPLTTPPTVSCGCPMGDIWHARRSCCWWWNLDCRVDIGQSAVHFVGLYDSVDVAASPAWEVCVGCYLMTPRSPFVASS